MWESVQSISTRLCYTICEQTNAILKDCANILECTKSVTMVVKIGQDTMDRLRKYLCRDEKLTISRRANCGAPKRVIGLYARWRGKESRIGNSLSNYASNRIYLIPYLFRLVKLKANNTQCIKFTVTT